MFARYRHPQPQPANQASRVQHIFSEPHRGLEDDQPTTKALPGELLWNDRI